MNSGGLTGGIYKPLSPEQVELIRSEALRLLEEIGMTYEMYVIDDEIIGQACKILEGISTGKDHLAFETIGEVGPGGNYLLSGHTLQHLRSE